jgi:hypothetical protein
MRSHRVALVPAVVLAAGLALAGCGQRADHGLDAHRATVTYTCCRQADIAPVRHPGDAVQVHWIVSAGPPSASSNAAPVTLSASLSGPYPDVNSLKMASTPVAAATAAPVRTTDGAVGAPTSTLVVPADAASGFYNLTFAVESEGATRSGASIIRVAAHAP